MKKRSAKQIAASRANLAKSKGPVTPQGKRNSSRNRMRHGFSRHDPSLVQSPRQAFVTLRSNFIASYQPSTPLEVHLVHTFAVARWRFLRVEEALKIVLDKTMALQQVDFADPLTRARLAPSKLSRTPGSAALPSRLQPPVQPHPPPPGCPPRPKSCRTSVRTTNPGTC
jgi:hypothetical protein